MKITINDGGILHTARSFASCFSSLLFPGRRKKDKEINWPGIINDGNMLHTPYSSQKKVKGYKQRQKNIKNPLYSSPSFDHT